MSDKHKSDFMPEELDHNSELLSPKDEDQGNLLRGIVNLKSLTSEAIPSATQFFKRAYKISHFCGL